MIETIDGVYGLEQDKARTLAKRMYYIGWFGLPWCEHSQSMLDE